MVVACYSNRFVARTCRTFFFNLLHAVIHRKTSSSRAFNRFRCENPFAELFLASLAKKIRPRSFLSVVPLHIRTVDRFRERWKHYSILVSVEFYYIQLFDDPLATFYYVICYKNWSNALDANENIFGEYFTNPYIYYIVVRGKTAILRYCVSVIYFQHQCYTVFKRSQNLLSYRCYVSKL